MAGLAMKVLALRFALLLLAGCSWTRVGFAQGECPSYPPVLKVDAVNMYSDAKSSVVDPAKVAQNARLQKDLWSFVNGLGDMADTILTNPRDFALIDCVRENLASWAKAGALMEPPKWSAAFAKQSQAIVALQFIFLKLEASGVQLPEKTRTWQRQTLLVMLLKKPEEGNIMVWLGAAAAGGDLLEPSSDLRRFHNAVWMDATRGIAENGTVAVELKRGQRAFIYHTFYYNALAALWTSRKALAIEVKPLEVDALNRLSTMIGAASCEASQLAQLVGVQQEKLDRWNLSMAAAFAAEFNTQDWLRCTITPNRFPGLGWGGRFDLSVRAIEALGRRKLPTRKSSD